MSSTSDTSSPKPTFFLNLPVTSLSAAKTFYTNLDFTPVPAWSDNQSISFLLPVPNQSIALMLHTHARFKTFMRPSSAVADTKATTEGLFSVMCTSKQAVDDWLEKAEKAGGKKDPYVMEKFGENMGMYVRSWEDPDGHMWEAFYMLSGQGMNPQVAVC